MPKRIGVLYFSQTGQLKEIVNGFVAPFLSSKHEIDLIPIVPKTPFPFPWNAETFFGAMPESVLQIPAPIEQPVFKFDTYDLLILAYQPWFLSPSIPITSALANTEVIKRLSQTPVILLGGARNMWISAKEKIITQLANIKARVVGHVCLTDQNPNLISAITIQYWMFSGKKDKLWGLFPVPGISPDEINRASFFGALAMKKLEAVNWDGYQEEVVRNNGLLVKTNLLFIEQRASLLFKIWASVIIKKKNRKRWLTIFKYYLLIALFLVAPIVLFFYTIFIKPFSRTKINQLKKLHLGLAK